jgi:hypothetical protein
VAVYHGSTQEINSLTTSTILLFFEKLHVFPQPLYQTSTMANTDECTLQTCLLSAAYIGYRPNVPGNMVYLALFAVLMVGQVGAGIKYRTWSFMVPMAAGLILEVIGYLGRVFLHNNPFNFDAFLM